MSEMIEFYRAQLDEDERVALAVADHRGRVGELRWTQTNPEHQHGLIGDELGNVVTYDEGSPTPEQAAHIVRHDPARVLAEVEAKRRILDEYAALDANPERLYDVAMHMAYTLLGNVVRLQVQPYAEHPDYQDEWRP